MLSPSRWLRRLLERTLGPSEQHVLGDLEEEFRVRVRPSTPWVVSECWYVLESISLLFAVARSRSSPGRGRNTGTTDDTSREGIMDGMGRDLLHALRGLRRQLGTTLVIGLTLAVAVGATTAIFSVANATFLRPLPYPGADRMVGVYTGFRENPEAALAVSPLDWKDFDDFEGVIEQSGVWSVGESVHMTDGEQPLRLVAPRASADLFRILGADAVVGRFFTAEEEIPGRDDAVVLSHGLWVRVFGADPRVIERSVVLDGRSYRVVGVTPERGLMPREADVWLPLALGPEWFLDNRWGWQFLGAVARLTPGTDVSTATRSLNTRLAEATPDRVNRLGQTRVVRSLYDERSDDSGPVVLMLLAAAGLVLAMACANVMNVMLARSETRTREFGLRRALGSGAAPLARLVLMETVLLAAIGAVGGLMIAHVGLKALAAAELESLAALGPIGIDLSVLFFGLLLTVATVALFGGAPMLGVLRADPQVILKETPARAGVSQRASRFRDGLVVVQVAMALTLLVAVGLSASAFRGLVTSDPGFDPSSVLTATIELPADTDEEAARSDFYRALMDRLGSLPGVASAGAANFLPLEGVGWSSSFELIDKDPLVTDSDPGGNMRAVSVDYFTSVGIPLVEGRLFADMDGPDAMPVAIVDETLAGLFWPSGSPVGRQALIRGLSETPATIVGVVGDVPHERLGQPRSGHVYFPVLQSPQRRMTLVLKTDGDPAALTPSVRDAIRTLDARVPVTEVSTLETRVRESLSGPRIGLLLLVAFGAAAALLAAVGIYGVLAYTVARRTGEMGTRMALGAAPSAVLATVVRQAMRLWLIGTVVGVAASYVAADVLQRYVAGVELGSLTAYVGAFSALGLIALLAATIPAWRATAVDPVEALRAD